MNYNFINPYNFIPMGTKKSKGTGKGTLSGVIEYSVLTKTPLFIPNTSNDHIYSREGEDHKSYDFYSYEDLEEKKYGEEEEVPTYAPVIPGSEIRGMFRSNFEILTNSCLSSLEGTGKLLSKRTMTSYEAGLLKRERDKTFILVKAQDVLWRTKGANSTEDEDRETWKKNASKNGFYDRQCYIQDDFEEGEKVYFQIEDRGKMVKPLATNVCAASKAKKGYGATGYMIKGVEGPEIATKSQSKVAPPQKHCCHIFTKNQTERIVWELTAGDENFERLERLFEIYTQYQDEKKLSYEEYHSALKKFIKGEGNTYFPIYYSIVEEQPKKKKILYLSPACKTREVYNKSIHELSDEMKPCDDLNDLCEACALFGTLIKGKGHASKLRFSDLKTEERDDYSTAYMELVTLQPLSSPKLSNTEFYLKRPKDAIFWTYEYYVDKKRKVHVLNGQLAGRKFYWHDMNPKKYAASERTSQNMTVHPVKSGITFLGKIYFENLTEEQLNRLLYVINAGESGALKEKQHGYKLGAAKPLGFGSIACAITSVKLKKYVLSETKVSRELETYKEFAKKSCDGSSFDKKRCEDYGKMTSFNALKTLEDKKIVMDYPRKKQNGNIYEWFSSNHKGNKREQLQIAEYMEAMEPILRKTIPSDVENESVQQKSNRQQNSNSRKNVNQENRSNSEKKWTTENQRQQRGNFRNQGKKR